MSSIKCDEKIWQMFAILIILINLIFITCFVFIFAIVVIIPYIFQVQLILNCLVKKLRIVNNNY